MAAKKLKVGDVFVSVSRWALESKPLLPQILKPEPYHQYREGHKEYFQKGNRRYYCEVIAIVGMATKWVYNYFPNSNDVKYGHAELGVKQYQFTYLLKVLEQ